MSIGARRLLAAVVVSLCASIAGLAFSSAPALAVKGYLLKGQFGTAGSGDGEFSSPAGIALNDSLVEAAAGDVYVVDRGNSRVERFSSTGAFIAAWGWGVSDGKAEYEVCTSGCQAGIEGSGAGQLDSPAAVAVDNSGDPLVDPSAGDVYVTNKADGAVIQFSSTGAFEGELTGTCENPGESAVEPGACPASATKKVLPFGELLGVAADHEGNLWVYTTPSAIDEFGDTGSFMKTFTTSRSTISAFAVDSSENVYAGCECGVLKFSSTGVEQEQVAFGEATALAVDPSTNNVFVDRASSIEKFGPFGEPYRSPVATFPVEGLPGSLSESHGLAVSESGTVFATQGGLDDVEIFSDVVGPDVTTGEASGLQVEGSATLSGTVNPDGEPLSTCMFEYGTEAGAYTNTAECAQAPGSITGTAPVKVSASVSGLTPYTVYHYRLVAGNTNVTIPGNDRAFVDPGRPNIVEESVSNVASTSATLVAEIDPGGADTKYRFEYAPAGGEYKPVPEGEGDMGSGATSVPVHVHIDGSLEPGTAYRFRVIATNVFEAVDGAEHAFTTQSAGGLFALPDGREYELVSPPQKDGSEIVGIGGESKLARFGGATQAADDGESVTYLANAPVNASASGNPIGVQLFSTRVRDSEGGQEWRTRDISVPHRSHLAGAILVGFEEYVGFSSDLSQAVLLPTVDTVEPPLAAEIHQEVQAGYLNELPEIYLRDDANGVFRAVNTVEPLSALQFEGATADLDHVLFQGPVGLDPHYPGDGGLYEWSDRQTRLVDVLPEGEVGSGVLASAPSGFPSGPLRNAISDDGARVVWGSGGALYTRDMATDETVQVDAAQGGAGPSGGGTFVAASSDGIRVLFTDSGELTSGAHEGGLFMFDVLDGKLTDLTPAGTGGQMQTSFGVNEEATSLYELSSAVLTKEPSSQGKVATEGESNLYLLHEEPDGSWRTTFIAAGAEGSGAPQGDGEARTSPNGRYLAFMSKQSLTGYDTEDATSNNAGERMDEEVYLYSAEANRLVCVSCNPTGERPVAEYDNTTPISGGFPVSPMDAMGVWEGSWLAGSIPSVTRTGYATSSGYQPRFLSDSGRLFFDSADGLVPRDVNGHADVYEYEPAGLGSCVAPSYGQSGSVIFEVAEGGCVGLISAGTGSRDSVFFDASANGSDVFFTTEQGLVPQDSDGASDMYDARVCTDSEPCPIAATVSPPCTTPDSCRVAPAPQPGVFGAPSSATFSGQGNVTATVVPRLPKKVSKKAVKCRKGHRRSHGKCVLGRKSGHAKRVSYKRGGHS